MKKIVFILIGLLLASVIAYAYIDNKDTSTETDGVTYTEILETSEGYTTNMVIEKGDYEEGDIVYLSYISEDNETSLLDIFVTKVLAIEEGDVIAYHEVTTVEVEKLKDGELSVPVELTLTDEEVETIGAQNLSKHIRANKVSNSNEEEQLRIKNKYQMKEQEYIQYKAKKGNEDTGNGNEDTGNGNEDTGNGNEDSGNGNEDTGNGNEDVGQQNGQ